MDESRKICERKSSSSHSPFQFLRTRKKKIAGILLLKMENVFRVASVRVALLDERMDSAKSHRGLPLPLGHPSVRAHVVRPRIPIDDNSRKIRIRRGRTSFINKRLCRRSLAARPPAAERHGNERSYKLIGNSNSSLSRRANV